MNGESQYVEGEVAAALRAQFGADAVERCDDDRQLFSVFFDAAGCFLIEIVAVGGGVDMLDPEENRRSLAEQFHAA